MQWVLYTTCLLRAHHNLTLQEAVYLEEECMKMEHLSQLLMDAILGMYHISVWSVNQSLSLCLQFL